MASNRYNGNVVPFADNATGSNRTVFGDTNLSDNIDDNLNDDYKLGWEIVGINDSPTKQDFNALGYTQGKLISHLYQQGISEYNAAQEYYLNSLVMGSNGVVYQSLSGTEGSPNTGNNPITDNTNWKIQSGTGAYVIDTVDDFGTVPSGIDTVIVKDMNRGGTFIYDATQSAVNNGGTIFNGWVRQYSGAVNVKWFGAVADCDSSPIVGDVNYFNPSGTDNSIYFQKAIDVATLSNSSVYIPASELWYKIGKPLDVTCGTSGERTEGCKLKFIDNGTSIRTSFEINAVENAVFENFTCDFSVSSDPTDWRGNYDNFTGRKGIRAVGLGSNLVLKNINVYNSFQAGVAFYDGADTFIIDNVHINRTRGNYGDGFYFSGTSKKAKITNCSAYDFTRIGIVTDSPDGGIIEDCVIDNCSFEYGHHYSYLYGGTEFNSGIWLENTARSIIKNCTAKNIDGRGFTVTSGDASLTIADYTECYSIIDSCVAEDTGAGFVLDQMSVVNINHRVINCSAINCTRQDIAGESSSDTGSISNVYVSNFYSEKSFVTSQARCLDFRAGVGGTINVIVNGFKVKSDFDHSTFAYAGNGHISEYSNFGTVNYTIKDFKDTNGVVIDKDDGGKSGVIILENIDNIYGNQINCEDLIATNCIFNRYSSDMSPVNTLKFYNCVFNSSFTTVANTDIVFSNCEFNVPSDGHIWIANNYASINEPNKVIVKFLNCNFYKDFTGTTKYAIKFSTKDTYKTGLYISGCFFYNLATTGVGAYAMYFNNGFSSFLGNNNYLDNTVQYPFTNYSAPQTSETVLAKIALQ